MAFVTRNISVLAYANGFTLWHYVSPDKMAAIREPSYFNGAEYLRKGDMVLVNSGDVSGTLVVSQVEDRIETQPPAVDVMAGG
jgi:hypothetical protein